MKKRWMMAGVFGVALLALGWVGADETAPKGEAKAVRKAGEEYAAALNSGDLDKLLGFWTSDADFIDEDGHVVRGRQAIGERLRESIRIAKGTTIKFETTQLRFLRPDVALEDGVSYTEGDEGAPRARFSAVWVKSNGKWLLSSVRELPASAAAGTARSPLQDLGWLVGDWTAEGKGPALSLSVRWALDKKFLVLDYKLTAEDGDKMEITKWIGWDPLNEQIRSWVFDSAGGLGDGFWRREGNRWVIEAEGTLPDGRTGSGMNVLRAVNDKTFLWTSIDRQVDGIAIADSETRFIRK